ncbi:hypothetical protein [Paenibacillus sp.]
MRYAMVCKNRVIDILENPVEAPRWPADDKGNEVTAVECDNNVKVGMFFDTDSKTFCCYIPKVRVDKLTRIEILLNASKEKIENAAIDAYTEDLIEGGIL